MFFKSKIVLFSTCLLLVFFAFASKTHSQPQIAHQRFSFKTHTLQLFDHSDGVETINSLRSKFNKPVAIINGPLFHSSYKTVGLYIKNGVQSVPLNTKNGKGNFFIKPNGVFYIQNNQAEIVTTKQYQKLLPNPELAIQSGPLLLINGKINPTVKGFVRSKKNRSAIVKYNNGDVGVVISTDSISMSDFSKIIRDNLKVQHALYLDGAIAGYWSREYQHNLDFKYASLLVVVPKSKE